MTHARLTIDIHYQPEEDEEEIRRQLDLVAEDLDVPRAIGFSHDVSFFGEEEDYEIRPDVAAGPAVDGKTAVLETSGDVINDQVECVHESYWLSVSPVDGMADAVKFYCRQCGRSGSIRIDEKNINWR